MRQTGLWLLSLIAVCFTAGSANGQSCYTRQSVGGASSVTLVAAIPVSGTSVANTNALENDQADGSYYQLSTFTGPATVTVATALVSGSIADNDHAPFGITFINGSADPVTITQVDITSDRAKTGLFRVSPKPTAIEPLAGTWNVIDLWTARWSGSITVPAKSCQAFIADVYVSNVRVNITDVDVGGVITSSIGTLTAMPFPTDLFVPLGSRKVATAVVGFVDAGRFPSTTSNATNPPPNLVGGLPSIITLRVKEWSNNQPIASGLSLTVTIPPEWSNVSLAAAPAPWSAGTVSIVQPTATTPGSFSISTSAVIPKGGSTGDVQILLTPPVVYTKSTFVMRASLSGSDTSSPAHPIRSVCDGGGTILPQSGSGGGVPLNVEFLSPRLNASGTSAPVGDVEFRTDLSVVNGSGTQQIDVQAFNRATGLWNSLPGSPVTPTSLDSTVTWTSSGSALYDYLDSQSRMRVRFVSNPPGPLTLRIDYMSWMATLYWAVDNSIGADTNPGSVRLPFRTMAGAMAAAAGGEQVRVFVGNSRSGTPYDHDLSITTSGTPSCPTLLQGVPDSSGMLPLIVGVNPASDAGILVGGHDVAVDSFQVDNTQVGLYTDIGSSRARFSNCFVRVPDNGYGVLLYTTSSSTVSGNRIEVLAGVPLTAIYDYSGNANAISGNRISGFNRGQGIWSFFSTAPLLQQNIIQGCYHGIWLSWCTGPLAVHNNTIDGSVFRAIYSEGTTGTVTSRNNILTNNGIGWAWDGRGAIDSDYEDLFGNTSDYTDRATVVPGAHSISVDPAFVQTSNPAQTTYYALSPGSPCIDAGTSVGLPFRGTAPDIGAVEY